MTSMHFHSHVDNCTGNSDNRLAVSGSCSADPGNRSDLSGSHSADSGNPGACFVNIHYSIDYLVYNFGYIQQSAAVQKQCS